MELNLDFKTPKTISIVSLRIMEELATGIFPPESIEIWGKLNSNGKFKRIQTLKIPVPREMKPHELYAIDVKIKPTNFKELKIVARPLEKIPQWHGAKDKRALLLVDEIFLN